MTPKRITPLVLAFVVGLAVSGCEDPSSGKGARSQPNDLSIQIAAPPHHTGKRVIDSRKSTHFNVVLTNNSGEPMNLWREWCSWGYFCLKFELTDPDGTTFVAEKVERSWTRNFPDWDALPPGESRVVGVFWTDTQKWKGFPLNRIPEDIETFALTMKAIYEVADTPEAREHKIWTGRTESAPLELELIRLPQKATPKQSAEQDGGPKR